MTRNGHGTATSLVRPLLGFAWAFLLLHVSCGPRPLKQSIEWKHLSAKAYDANVVGRSLPLPSGSTDIDVYLFAGFDTNYRFIRAQTVTMPKDGLPSLLSQFLDAFESVPEDTRAYRTNNVPFVGARVFAAFPSAEGNRPNWWNETDMHGFERNLLMAWDDGEYGYGYWLFYDENSRALCVFQWSEQHLLLPFLRAGIERGERIVRTESGPALKNQESGP